jgi:predicted DNA-binding transcriptional regulator AlpA
MANGADASGEDEAMIDRLLNVKEVAALLGLAPGSIYHFVT